MLDGFGEIFGVFTNNHVLNSTSEAENAFATFGYVDASGGQRVKLRPEVIFRTNKVSFLASMYNTLPLLCTCVGVL